MLNIGKEYMCKYSGFIIIYNPRYVCKAFYQHKDDEPILSWPNDQSES